MTLSITVQEVKRLCITTQSLEAQEQLLFLHDIKQQRKQKMINQGNNTTMNTTTLFHS